MASLSRTAHSPRVTPLATSTLITSQTRPRVALNTSKALITPHISPKSTCHHNHTPTGFTSSSVTLTSCGAYRHINIYHIQNTPAHVNLGAQCPSLYSPLHGDVLKLHISQTEHAPHTHTTPTWVHTLFHDYWWRPSPHLHSSLHHHNTSRAQHAHTPSTWLYNVAHHKLHRAFSGLIPPVALLHQQ